MTLTRLAYTLAVLTTGMGTAGAAQQTAPLASSDTLVISALQAPVEIIRDRWGISHIYAETEYDLFFAQGLSAARDRLFQLEIWRRQATGTVAEILGPREVERDIGTRLFRFRGDLTQELNHYHPRGETIIKAFVDGVNAYIGETERHPELLPLEFELLDIKPGRWTPDIVVSRHQGLLGNIGQELSYGRAVARLGEDQVKQLIPFGPGEPVLTLDSAIDGALLSADILARYNAFRRPIRFRPEDIVDGRREDPEAFARVTRSIAETRAEANARGNRETTGSNNWVVSGERTLSRSPIMANDPHRAQSAPSLRYWVHLVGPGWNVIGGGEPEIPGVSIGHNEYGAWGLTVFATDGEDLYVYDTNPANPSEYRYRGRWEPMTVIPDTIRVEGGSPVFVDLKYTRHGSVVFEDPANRKAYAVRAAWMEVGGAPYLASLRMDQARTWEEFREACRYSNIPGENMVWADIHGDIGWQAVGIAPIRSNWSGLVPVPGDGRFEWDGYLPIGAKPHVVNPEQGYFATANNDLIPRNYPYRNAVGWTWSDPFRWARASEVLAAGRRHSMMDMMRLQTDELSLPARTLTPLLEHVSTRDQRVEDARRRLLDWNHVLDRESVAAGIYVAWERRLQTNVHRLAVPDAAQSIIGGVSMSRIIEWLIAPSGIFGHDPLRGRDSVLLASLSQAVADLTEQLGRNMSQWRYGQPDYKHATIRHPLSAAVDETTRRRLDVGPAPRGGNSYTLNNTGSGNNQTSGASFRLIVDTSNWDAAVGANTPGQGGNPDDPHYRDLFPIWADNAFFPVFYSRGKVESVADRVTMLMPR